VRGENLVGQDFGAGVGQLAALVAGQKPCGEHLQLEPPGLLPATGRCPDERRIDLLHLRELEKLVLRAVGRIHEDRGVELDLGVLAAEFLNPTDAVVFVKILCAADEIAFVEPCRAGFGLRAEGGQHPRVNKLRQAPTSFEAGDDLLGSGVVRPGVLDHAAPLGVAAQLGVEQAERRGEDRKLVPFGDEEVGRAELRLAGREGDLGPLEGEDLGDGGGTGARRIGPEEDSQRSMLFGEERQAGLEFHPVAHRECRARDVEAVCAGQDLIGDAHGPRVVVGQRPYRQRLGLHSSASCARPATRPLRAVCARRDSVSAACTACNSRGVIDQSFAAAPSIRPSRSRRDASAVPPGQL